jgi:hypothetical protein
LCVAGFATRHLNRWASFLRLTATQPAFRHLENIMLISKRTTTLTTFLIVLMNLSASNVHAQLCGYRFARFVVSDSAGESVSNSTIELLTGVSGERYKEVWETYGNKEFGLQQTPFKISLSVASDIIKQNSPLERTQDLCGNPLKQRANKTKVKTTMSDKNEASAENFGFCTGEGGEFTRYLLKISAPGYVTDYYIGSYLGGCNDSWKFVITKKKKSKEQSLPKRNAQQFNGLEGETATLLSNLSVKFRLAWRHFRPTSYPSHTNRNCIRLNYEHS